MLDYIRALREKVGPERILVPSTACIILNEHEEVLLEQRSDSRHWGLPGGIMDIDETATASARREVAEETGLELQDLWLFGVYSGPQYKGEYPNGDRIAVVQLAFVAERYAGEPRASAESLALAFYPLTKLPEPLVGHHVEFLTDFRDYLNGRRTIPVVK